MGKNFMNIEPFIEIAKEVEALPTYIDLMNYVNSVRGTEKYDRLLMYAKSLYLFTAGNVQAVRDSTHYNPKKAQYNVGQVPSLVHVLDDEEISRGSPTRFDYKIAGGILKALASRNDILIKPAGFLYRGLTKLRPSVYLGLCKPGKVYDIGAIASTSLHFEVAEDFSDNVPRWNLVYELDNSKAKKGLYTGRFTSGFSDEEEVILGGKIKVISFKWQPKWKLLRKEYTGPTPGVIDNHDDLIYYVNVFSKYAKNDRMLAGQTIVKAEVV
jgi:hypothetical protein